MQGARTIPSSLLSSDTWSDTGKLTGTFSDPRWVENSVGDVALRKPGRFVLDGVEAAREVVASHIGGWLGVNISSVELIPTHPDGPCCVSRAIAGSVVPFGQIMRAPFSPPSTRSAAVAALPELGSAIVLDALLGNCDRFNDGNIVYAEAPAKWYSLDYSLSFNMYQPAAVGDPSLAFGQNPTLRQVYFPEILQAVRTSPFIFQDTVKIAETITDDEFSELFALLPESHASQHDAGSMLAFVKQRRSAIRDILRAWCASVNLGGIL